MLRQRLEGRDYWAIRVPRWWLHYFGYGYIRGGLIRRFLVQRQRRKLSIEIGSKLDSLALPNRLCRHPGETDADFRERLLAKVSGDATP